MFSNPSRCKLPVIWVSLLILTLVGCKSKDLITSPIPVGQEITSAVPNHSSIPTRDLTFVTPEPPPPTILPTLTPEPPTPTILPTLPPTLTINVTATATSTPMGVGSDLISFRIQKRNSDTARLFFSLQENGFVDRVPQPVFDSVIETENPARMKIILEDGNRSLIKTIFECPVEVKWCMPIILSGQPSDEWIYLAILPSLSGEQMGSDLVIYNQKTGETRILERFDALIGGYQQFPGSSAGLLAVDDKKLVKSFLYIYDLQTLDKKLVIRENLGFCGYGFLPDHHTFWYRTCDTCETRFVRKDGTRIPSIKTSDGIIGWVDGSHFLIYTTNNNPPVCTRNGITVANTSGLTGKMIIQDVIGQAALSRDGTKLTYTTDCISLLCKRLILLDLNTNQTRILYENEDGIFGLNWMDE